MVIYGRGMMATAFKDRHRHDDGLLVFASGVSDSANIEMPPFEREFRLLEEAMAANPGRKIVYFSSCAAGFADTPYYRHKLAMERRVEQATDGYLICRLPQVVGFTVNNTLVSHLAKSIRTGTPIPVTPNAKRSLIDVEDVVRIVHRLAPLPSMKIQISSGTVISIETLISEVVALLGTPALVMEGKPETWPVRYDGRPLKDLIGADDPIFAAGYDREVLRKYVPRMT